MLKYQASLDRPEGFWCVESFDFMEALSPQELEVLLNRVQLIHYGSGETIFFPGDKSNLIYCLMQGRVGLSFLSGKGKRYTFAIVGRGQMFGESALAGEMTRNWSAESLTKSSICIIHRDDFLSFAKNNARFALGISKLINNRLIEFENKVEDLLFQRTDTRLANTLLKLSNQFGEAAGDRGVRIPFKLTNRELATLIGSSRETTSTLMATLKRKGVISKNQGMILIEDRGALEAYAKENN